MLGWLRQSSLRRRGRFWKEYAWMAGAVWLGAIGALVVANLILGGAFL